MAHNHKTQSFMKNESQQKGLDKTLSVAVKWNIPIFLL